MKSSAWNLAKDVYKLKEESGDAFYSPAEARAMPAPSSKNPEDRQFVIDSGASMHMMSKKDLSSGALGTLKRSRIPITVVTANGEVQTIEVAQVYVHDLHIFVTVQLLGNTPVMLSLGKLCKDPARATYDQKRESRPSARPTTSSFWQFQVYHRVPPQLHPRHPANARSHEGGSGNCSEGIPEWIEHSTEKLEIAEIPAAAEISHVSDPERPKKVASRKHSSHTHFPKDQNCEVCKRTKITRAPCTRRTGNTVLRAEKFGDLITADHKVLNEGCESRHNHRYAVVV